MIHFMCHHCDHEIESNYPVCNECASAEVVRDVKAAVQEKYDELIRLNLTTLLGEAYKGEIRAYTQVLNILEKL